jgi:hypothetical protein
VPVLQAPITVVGGLDSQIATIPAFQAAGMSAAAVAHLVKDREQASGKVGRVEPQHEATITGPDRCYGGEGIVLGCAVPSSAWGAAVQAALADSGCG